MKKILLIIAMLGAVVLAGCGGQKTATAPQAAVVEEAAAVEAGAVEEAAAEAEVQPVVAEQPIDQSGTTVFEAMEGLFSLEIPAGWSQEQDSDLIENAVVDTFTAPDGKAFVQVLVNETNVDIDAVQKGQYTLDFMRRLYGSDLRVAKDVALADGREMLEWWSDMNEISGRTYFDTAEGYLFFTSTYAHEDHEKTYRPVLEQVDKSFEY